MQKLVLVVLFLSANCLWAADYPKVQLANRELRVMVYLPDAQKGFYRATRFDWSGMIGSLEYKGHDFYGPWFSSVDNSVRDFDYKDGTVVVSPQSAATGPAEEYQTNGAALGYAEAKGGDTFVKIGIGALRKPAGETKYDHLNAYEIVDGGKWSVHNAKNSVEFMQELTDAKSPYAYKYTKIVRLEGDKARLVIEHTLRNTGTRTIQSSIYNHNFWTLDKHPPGPELVTTAAYQIQTQRPPAPEVGEIRGNQLLYRKTLEGKERLTAALDGFGPDAKDFDFRVEDSRAGVGVHITSDHALFRVGVWSISSVFALEPFVDLKLESGAEASWKLIYDYYTLPQSGK